MKENKDIRTKNKKGQLHGYQEWYFDGDGKLWIRANGKNEKPIGYWESHLFNHTKFYII